MRRRAPPQEVCPRLDVLLVSILPAGWRHVSSLLLSQTTSSPGATPGPRSPPLLSKWCSFLLFPFTCQVTSSLSHSSFIPVSVRLFLRLTQFSCLQPRFVPICFAHSIFSSQSSEKCCWGPCSSVSKISPRTTGRVLMKRSGMKRKMDGLLESARVKTAATANQH